MIAKTNDEIQILSTIKIYSYFSFVFSVVPKEVRVVENIESDEATLEGNHYNHAKIVDERRINFLVSSYCTLKENIRFPEVALVSVHYNCLIGSILIVIGHRP